MHAPSWDSLSAAERDLIQSPELFRRIAAGEHGAWPISFLLLWDRPTFRALAEMFAVVPPQAKRAFRKYIVREKDPTRVLSEIADLLVFDWARNVFGGQVEHVSEEGAKKQRPPDFLIHAGDGHVEVEVYSPGPPAKTIQGRRQMDALRKVLAEKYRKLEFYLSVHGEIGELPRDIVARVLALVDGFIARGTNSAHAGTIELRFPEKCPKARVVVHISMGNENERVVFSHYGSHTDWDECRVKRAVMEYKSRGRERAWVLGVIPRLASGVADQGTEIARALGNKLRRKLGPRAPFAILLGHMPLSGGCVGAVTTLAVDGGGCVPRWFLKSIRAAGYRISEF